MARTILYNASETGTAAYLLPLWERLHAKNDQDWRVLSSGFLDTWMEQHHLTSSSFIRPEPHDVESLTASLQGFQPELIITSAANRPLDEVVRAYGKKHNIPRVAIIDTWYGYRKRLLDKNGVLHQPDAILVIDNTAISEARSEGLEEQRLHAIGHPAWENTLSHNIPPANPAHIAFINQPIERHYGNSLGYTEHTAFQMLVATLLSHPDLAEKVIYCPHPDDAGENIPTGMPIEVITDGRDALFAAGTVIGMFSSLLSDAFLSGRKTISWQPGAPDAGLCSLARHDYIAFANTAEGLCKALRNPPHDDAKLRTTLIGSTDRLQNFVEAFAA